VTIDTFMEKLAQTPHTWQVDGDSLLRGYYNGVRYCPLQAVAGDESLDRACRQIDLTIGEKIEIMRAADFFFRTDFPLHAALAAATVDRSAQ
jgi:hypothetical protein